MAKKKRVKLSKENLAIALFISSVPKLIELWKNNAPNVTFDEFCISQYEQAKSYQNKK